MPETANIALRDSIVRHQVYLQRLAKGISAKVNAILNDTEDDLARMIRDRLENAQGLDTPADVKRMQYLLKLIEGLRSEAWKTLDSTWQEQLEALAKAEPNFTAKQLDVTSPVVLDLVSPEVARLRKIVSSTPFEGKTLKEWSQTLQDTDLTRIKKQIQLGMSHGEDSATIARRIVGTAKLKGTDGVTQITRNNAEAITRTAVNFVSNQARQEFVKLNKDVLSEEMYLATLDSRTTPICRSLDGNIYDVGKGPVPPLHFGCRSTRVPVFDGTAIGTRPTRGHTEQLLLREYSKANGINPPVTSRDDLPHGTKGKFDAFSRKRIRELTGSAPAATTYQEFLESQPAEVQDDILGKTKGLLFRKGGLTLDKYVGRDGDELTLHELARTQAKAFRAAGLNPDDY
jgi:SPP1 gp7 family putative phage head morphogenesis protein